ncbi:hypothetical protein KUV57_11830 [Epibacterium sp. DP7N7-1]|nr:hypothetical protein [Epibacterium sp. DP7N7-1]
MISLSKLIRHLSSPKGGNFTKIGRGVIFGQNVALGQWTAVGRDAVIGNDVTLGDWSVVGQNSVVMDGCKFGPWASVGRGATLEPGVTLGTHSIIQDGTRVPTGTVVGDNDIFGPDGVRENAVGGFVIAPMFGCDVLRGCFGTFIIPDDEFLLPNSWDGRLADQMFEEYKFGRSHMLELCRVDTLPENEDDLGKLVEKIREALLEERKRATKSPEAGETLTETSAGFRI